MFKLNAGNHKPIYFILPQIVAQLKSQQAANFLGKFMEWQMGHTVTKGPEGPKTPERPKCPRCLEGLEGQADTWHVPASLQRHIPIGIQYSFCPQSFHVRFSFEPEEY